MELQLKFELENLLKDIIRDKRASGKQDRNTKPQDEPAREGCDREKGGKGPQMLKTQNKLGLEDRERQGAEDNEKANDDEGSQVS